MSGNLCPTWVAEGSRSTPGRGVLLTEVMPFSAHLHADGSPRRREGGGLLPALPLVPFFVPGNARLLARRSLCPRMGRRTADFGAHDCESTFGGSGWHAFPGSFSAPPSSERGAGTSETHSDVSRDLTTFSCVGFCERSLFRGLWREEHHRAYVRREVPESGHSS